MTTSKTGYRSGYAPLPSGVFVAPFPDPLRRGADLDDCIDGFRQLFHTQTGPDETAAVVIEPVLGEGGYIAAPAKLLDAIAELCAQHGILFIADEVQTGFGRTGKMFAIEHTNVHPDIIVMAKGIASGFPISAIGASAELMAQWPTGSHGGTYGGNPIGCAAALATIDVLTEPGFLDNVVERGRSSSTACAGCKPHTRASSMSAGSGSWSARSSTTLRSSPRSRRTACARASCSS